MTKDEAIHKALKVLNCLNNDRVYETAWVKGAINACEEALEQPAQEPVMISDCNAARQIWENNLKESEKILSKCKFAKSDDEQPAQEPVAWMKSALDNARDVCKYLDHDMVKEAKAHTKFFWDDIDKIKEDEEALEQPSQEPVAWMYYEKVTTSKEKAEIYVNNPIPLYTHPALQPAQEPVGVVSWHEGAVMGSIFPSSNMPKDGDKLYTHPHQWQGLTDDEYKQIVEVGFKLGYEACKCEQTLKEKNHG